MAILKTLAAGLNHNPANIPTPVSNTPVTSDYVFDIAVDNAGVALADNDVIEAMWLPKNCVLVPGMVYFACPELDTHATPLGLLNVGTDVATVLDEDNLVDAFATGATWQFQHGINNVAAAAGAFEAIGYSASDRKIIITAETVASTPAVAGKIYISIGYRNKRAGDTNTD